MRGLEFELAPTCSWSMKQGRGVVIGDTPEGSRSVGYLQAGIVQGPRIAGTIEGGAADWSVTRDDKILRPDVKLIITTDDGAKILVTYDGFLDLGPRSEALLRGEQLDTSLHPRTFVRMLTGSPEYCWVNRSPFIGIGLLEFRNGQGIVTYDIYEVTAPRHATPVDAA